ncbi:TonB-dependent receptor domain-containing protein [Sphingomonas sp.]|uniref:TonB-dependent receptor n=1 Tax=Sphingomonas sp. TaxID=28214 RepID=UPI00286E24C3|nr:TonB-dependent receptor [Sphingomonas sp.]
MIDQTPPPEPPPAAIVITAKALPDPAAERAYGVATLGRDALANAPSSQLDQLLKTIPGVQQFRRSDARSGHPTSHGVTLRALGGNASSRALLLLDGVPQADPFGGWVNWPAFDPAALAEVRVIRGGGSVAHGPGALAGVIAMTSSLAPGFDAGAYWGSRASGEGRLQLTEPVGGGVLSLSGRAARGDGFIPITRGTRGPADRPADYREASARALWSAPLTGGLDLQLSAAAFTDRRERGLAFTSNRTDGADAALRLTGRGAWTWAATGYAQARELRSSFASVDAGRSAATRVSLQDAVPSRAFGASVELRPPLRAAFVLRGGADARHASGESRELYSYVDGAPTRRRRAGGETVTAGTFAELTARLGAVTLSGGARIDHWRIADGELRERLLATGAVLRDDEYPDRTGWRPTARAGAVVDAGGGISARAAAYLGWRLPTLNELFRPFRAGPDATAANPSLDPERLRGAEAGVDYRSEGLELSATVFANRLSGGIANVTLGQGPGVFPGVGFVAAGGDYRQRRNVNTLRSHGIEASATARRGAWSANAGASLVDAEISADGAAAELDGLQPSQTPRIALSGGIAWETGRRAVSLSVRHVGAQYEDDRNQRRLGAATTLDAFAAWPLSAVLQIVARGENLFDKTVLAGIAVDGSRERATPRTLWLGLRFGARR